jgi:hypothetical protein
MRIRAVYRGYKATPPHRCNMPATFHNKCHISMYSLLRTRQETKNRRIVDRNVTFLVDNYQSREGSKIWFRVPRDSEPRMCVLARTSSNLPRSIGRHFLVVIYKVKRKSFVDILPMELSVAQYQRIYLYSCLLDVCFHYKLQTTLHCG